MEMHKKVYVEHCSVCNRETIMLKRIADTDTSDPEVLWCSLCGTSFIQGKTLEKLDRHIYQFLKNR